MNYGPLAPWYDELTGDVPYEAFAAYYESLFLCRGLRPATVLDLACGTGTLTCLMARRGYEMIGVDGSADMLAVAAEKAGEAALPVAPLYLCQDLTELDLYGTVEAAYSSLDGLNYLPPEALPEVFRRLHLFIQPGGLLIFDINLPAHLRELDGQVFVDEDEDVLCLWRADFDEEEACLYYGMDLFTRRGRLWQRDFEEHVEYAHEPAALETLLRAAGFTDIEVRQDGPQSDRGRVFILATREN